MLALLAAAWIGLAPATAKAPATTAPDAACPGALPHLGAATAAVPVRWYVDPAVPGALEIWLEARRLVGDYAPLVALTPVIVASPTHGDPSEETLRRWLVSVALAGRFEEGLRLVEREGAARIALRLARPESRAALARELDLDVARLTSPCAAALIDAGTIELRDRIRHSGGRAGRPPAFALGAFGAFEDGARLDGLRREIELFVRTQDAAPAREPAPRRKAVSERLVRPPQRAGMVVGGIGLPHRLVVFAEQEDHPNFLLLGPALALRSARPGVLAIQVIARGSTQQALQLRRRLCAAQHLGRQLEYLRVLARELAVDTGPGQALVELLDRTAEERRCPDAEADLSAAADGSRSLPDGLWLDGAAVHQRELAALEGEILRIEATRSPVDAVFSAAAPPEP